MFRMTVVAVATAVIASGTPLLAQTVAQGLLSGTPTERAACRRDVRKLCRHIKTGSGNDAFLQCLQEHRAKLSKECAKVLRSHGV